jgi:hypothetical protein
MEEDYRPTVEELDRYRLQPYPERIELLDAAIALVKMGCYQHLDTAIATVAAGV